MGRARGSRRRAGLLAILPAVAIAALLAVSLASRERGPAQPVFAQASPGTYAIALRNDGTADTVLAISAATGDAIEVSTLAHLDGYTSFAAVSPDGARLAAVVADAGTAARPLGLLVVVDLASGQSPRIAANVDQLQQPLWSPASDQVFVTRTASVDGPATSVTVVRVGLTGGQSEVMTLPGVAGAYPVGFDADGRLLVVAIDGSGSTLYRESGASQSLSASLTRDWRVSPDGSAIAFIEVDLADGLTYHATVAPLTGSPVAQAAAASAGGSGGQQLGVAWHPAGQLVTGQEPQAVVGMGAAQAASAAGGGFDIPIEYSPDGAYLAVEAWSGDSFANPGAATITIAGANGRLLLGGIHRFAGWTMR